MFWGGGFAIIAATCLLVSENLSLPAIAIAALVILWGARLWLHLFLRWRREGEEDYRYQRMRAHHGKNFWGRVGVVGGGGGGRQPGDRHRARLGLRQQLHHPLRRWQHLSGWPSRSPA